jgi:hypothetical protein
MHDGVKIQAHARAYPERPRGYKSQQRAGPPAARTMSWAFVDMAGVCVIGLVPVVSMPRAELAGCTSQAN